MVTVLKRGVAPVDPHSTCVDTHEVYYDNNEIWDAMLNQTDISGSTNSNKFYVIQLLHKGDGQCTMFTRWGRVGENGATQTKGPFSPQEAIIQFKKQFKAKTGTAWEHRHGMVPKKGKYTFLERVFEDESDNIAAGGSGANEGNESPIPLSKLEPEVQELCKVIFSTALLSAHLSSMNYDANKLPLGKLAKSTILKGFAILKELAEILEDPNPYDRNDAVFAELSGRYYSVIPHDFGRNRPTIINSMELLKAELSTLDNLGEMAIAQNIISSTAAINVEGVAINPLDSNFQSLGLSFMSPVSRTSNEFFSLQSYVKNTHGQTHNFSTEVLNAFRIERDAEVKAFREAGYDKLGDGERMLLWHGSRTTNFAGILKQGLRIAPPEAPVSGYMFGKGIYLADMMSKSANYCYASLSNDIGLLLLCEAAVRPFHELENADYNADQGCKSAKAMATKGIGRTQPVKWKDAGDALEHPELAGVYMPNGEGHPVNPAGAYLQYNEYIVYSPSQIRLRYLLMVKMR
ncbi:PARP-domain-containing protein [Hysterangium stoloniferum]|nr:PARP-domain-containing protein [Hysterangium stoloniferum]